MSDASYSNDELRQLGPLGAAIADSLASFGVEGVTFAAGDDEPCHECGYQAQPGTPEYATSAAHFPTCSAYLWDKR